VRVAIAHAYARSGDPIAIGGYLGKGDSFDKAITKFAFAYADQNDSDYKAFGDSIDNGQITAEKD
jgi:hypothetical protein